MVIRQLLRDSAIYFIPTLLARGIGLLLLPIYTRYLSPEEYGAVEILTVLYTLLNLVLPLEVSQAVARFSAEHSDAGRRSLFFSTAFWFTALVFAGWLAASMAFPDALSAFFLGREDDPLLIPAAASAMLANALLYLALNQLRWNLQQVPYVVVSLIFSVTLAVISATLIIVYGSGIYGVIAGQLAGSLVALACAAAYLSGTSPIGLDFSRGELDRLLTYSRPLVLSSFAVYLTTFSDRWMLNLWAGAEGVGIYSVALRIASVITLFTTSVQFALTPIIYSRYREAQTPASIEQFFQYYLLAAFTLIALVATFSGEIISVVSGPQFGEAEKLVAPVLLATLLMSLNVFAPGLSIAKQTSRIAVANGIGAAANLVVSALLIPLLGLIGAAIGTMIGASAIIALRFFWSQRLYHIPYRWTRYALALAVLLGVLCAVRFGDISSIGRAMLSLASAAAFAVLLLPRASALLTSPHREKKPL